MSSAPKTPHTSAPPHRHREGGARARAAGMLNESTTNSGAYCPERKRSRPDISKDIERIATITSRTSGADSRDVRNTIPNDPLAHPFRANFNDHFETSLAALRDVLPAIVELRQLTRPFSPEAFTIYDPYYCNGAVVEHWRSLGIPSVLHENRDFYADVRQGTVPGPYDMLVTNPPFSEDHMQRMMTFLILGQSRPWAFLAPDYVVSKPWYRQLIRKHFTPAPPTGKGKRTAAGRAAPTPRTRKAAVYELPPFLRAAAEAAGTLFSAEASAKSNEASPVEATTGSSVSSAPTEGSVALTVATATAASPAKDTTTEVVVGPEPFYIIPKERYDFRHPAGVGNDQSHFKSMWYVWPGRRLPDVLRGTTIALLSRPTGAGSSIGGGLGTVSDGNPNAKGAPPAIVHGLAALDEGEYVAATQRRANPQRRHHRQQQQRAAGQRW